MGAKAAGTSLDKLEKSVKPWECDGPIPLSSSDFDY